MACYDICVVGAGTIGSPAARYITEFAPHASVLLIGPFERKDRSTIDIHAAYYDQGRLTRPFDIEPAWSQLCSRSVASYRQTEKESGIPFFGEVGYLSTGKEGGSFLKKSAESAGRQGKPVEQLSRKQLSTLMPYFNFLPDEGGLYVEKNAGYVNIRDMVAAQRRLAQRGGCDIQDDVIKAISAPSGSDGYHRLETDSGRVYYARKVLLATGAFTTCRDLLPPSAMPELILKPIAVILVEVSEEDARRLQKMPSIVLRGSEEAENRYDFESYILPPIKYPDGKVYLKVGHSPELPESSPTPEEMHSWFNRTQVGSKEKSLFEMFRRYFPDIPIRNHRYDHCVITHTPHGYPYIDMLSASLGVVLAGNGRSAKCADEIGKVAAKMIVKGAWDSDLPQELFRFIKKVDTLPSKL